MRFNSDSQKLSIGTVNHGFKYKHSLQILEIHSGVRSFKEVIHRDDNMDYITIHRGNAVDFGNYTISNGTGNRGIIGSGTRGFGCGGESPSQGDSHNFIGKWEFASTGSSIDFANLTFTAKGGAGLSNGTRAVTTRGASGGLNNNDICFFTMASQQDAVDFGDNQSGSTYLACGTASPTRGVIICGRDTNGTANIIEFITIATTGNSQDFGDAVNTENAVATCAGGNSTRGVLAGGGDSSTTDVSYITYATTGNTVKFGDLHTGNGYAAPASDRITLVTGGGNGPTNRMDAVAIATGGTSTDFGDLNDSKTVMTGSSNGHGGLG